MKMTKYRCRRRKCLLQRALECCTVKTQVYVATCPESGVTETVICGYKLFKRCLFQEVSAKELWPVSQVTLVPRKKVTAFITLSC